MNNSIQAVAKMMIRVGERKIIDHLALSATNREEKNKREEKEIKEAKYSLVMPTDSVANYKCLARSLWLYSNSALLWRSDFQQYLPLRTCLRSWIILLKTWTMKEKIFFAGGIQLCLGIFINLCVSEGCLFNIPYFWVLIYFKFLSCRKKWK